MPAITPEHNLPYPLDTDPFSNGAEAIRDLALRLESRLPVRHLSVTVPDYAVTAYGTASVTVDYPVALSEQPSLVTAQGADPGTGGEGRFCTINRVDNLTATSCRITFVNGNNSARNVTASKVSLVIYR